MFRCTWCDDHAREICDTLSKRRYWLTKPPPVSTAYLSGLCVAMRLYSITNEVEEHRIISCTALRHQSEIDYIAPPETIRQIAGPPKRAKNLPWTSPARQQRVGFFVRKHEPVAMEFEPHRRQSPVRPKLHRRCSRHVCMTAQIGIQPIGFDLFLNSTPIVYLNPNCSCRIVRHDRHRYPDVCSFRRVDPRMIGNCPGHPCPHPRGLLDGGAILRLYDAVSRDQPSPERPLRSNFHCGT